MIRRATGRRGRAVMRWVDRGWLARSAAVAAGIVVASAAAGGGAGSRSAHADTPRDTPAAVEVDRDTAPAGRIGFGFDGGEPVDAWGASLAVSWLERPLELAAGSFGAGTAASRPVRRRQTLALGGALALGDSVVLDAALRASHQVGDRLRADGDPGRLARHVLHDLRIGARIRVAGDHARAALLRGDLTLPTGNADQLAGDASWTLAWSLIGRVTLAREIVAAGSVGIRLHGAEVVVGDRVIGDELRAAAGVAVPLSAAGLTGLAGKVAVSGEILGSLGDRVGGLAGPSPIEARLGVIVRTWRSPCAPAPRSTSRSARRGSARCSRQHGPRGSRAAPRPPATTPPPTMTTMTRLPTTTSSMTNWRTEPAACAEQPACAACVEQPALRGLHRVAARGWRDRPRHCFGGHADPRRAACHAGKRERMSTDEMPW
jgi:hypothetical protein